MKDGISLADLKQLKAILNDQYEDRVPLSEWMKARDRHGVFAAQEHTEADRRT